MGRSLFHQSVPQPSGQSGEPLMLGEGPLSLLWLHSVKYFPVPHSGKEVAFLLLAWTSSPPSTSCSSSAVRKGQ